MPSMTSRLAPLPKVRVARRSTAPGRPQTSQMSSRRPEPRRDEDDFSGAAELDCRPRLSAGEGAPLDDVLAIAGVRFTLDGDDRAREADVLGVERTEAILFEVLACMPGDDIAVVVDEAALALKQS